jgi:hypothetical protein
VRGVSSVCGAPGKGAGGSAGVVDSWRNVAQNPAPKGSFTESFCDMPEGIS